MTILPATLGLIFVVLFPDTTTSGFVVVVPSRNGARSGYRGLEVDMGSRSSSSSSSITCKSRRLLQVVADHEMEELEQNYMDPSAVSSPWIRTASGGFLPNLQLQQQLQQQQQRQSPAALTQIMTMEDYQRHVAEEREQLVCVRFYAPWCRACKIVAPAYRRLADQYPSIKFVECPVTSQNAALHAGLRIPSLPYVHLYHPATTTTTTTCGVVLVEERKLNRKVFAEFVKVLQHYVQGSCPIEDGDKPADQEQIHINLE